jgi:predicted transcriptional regulator
MPFRRDILEYLYEVSQTRPELEYVKFGKILKRLKNKYPNLKSGHLSYHLDKLIGWKFVQRLDHSYKLTKYGRYVSVWLFA